jgi:Tol biopolymer transport system component
VLGRESSRISAWLERRVSRSSATVRGDIFVSGGVAGGAFGAAVPVTELNDPVANDIQPNVRKDGKELVFSSNRAGTVGAQDIWVAARKNANQPWSDIANLGSPVNTAVAESRPSLSRDGRQLLFGRAPGPEGMSDIYVATRTVAKRR